MAASPATTATAAAIFPVLPICTPLGALVPRKSLITLSFEQETGGKETRRSGGSCPKNKARRKCGAAIRQMFAAIRAIGRALLARFAAGQSFTRRMIDHDGARLRDGAGEMR